MTPRTYALIVGLVMVAAGLVLGLMLAVGVTGTLGAASCGAPWTGSDPHVATNLFLQFSPQEYPALCSDARSARGLIAGIVLGLGIVIAVGAQLINQPKRITEAAPKKEHPAH